MTQYEPYKIKSIRNIIFNNQIQRKNYLRKVGYNVNLLSSSQVIFDMVTQGSSALSQEQFGSLFIGDEAYAGARNFYNLQDAVKKIFAIDNICPLHNRLGGLKLLSSIFVSKGKGVAGNTPLPAGVVEYYGGTYHLLPNKKNTSGNIDLVKTEDFLKQNKGQVAFIYLDLQGNGYDPCPLENLQELSHLCQKHQVQLIIDGSCITEYTAYLRKNNPPSKDKKTVELIKEISRLCHTMLVDAGQAPMSNVGSFLATNDMDAHEKHMNEVVVYEGLHTYGGMAGRTMEVFACGLREMTSDLLIDWLQFQVERLAELLKKAGVPFTQGFNGVYLHSDKFLNHIKDNQAHTLAAALYISSGIRANMEGKYDPHALLPILIPRRALMSSHIDQIGEAIIQLYLKRDTLPALNLLDKPEYNYEAQFEWLVPPIKEYHFTCEPYTIHSVEYVGMKTKKERLQAIKDGGYNTFLLKSEDVTIDFLTDSGTSAMSIDQWQKYLNAQETPATSDAYHDIVKTSQEIYGYQYIILTHQGRAAEHIMSQMFIKSGDYVPGNMYFTTTKLHQELAGGIFVDVIVDEAHNTSSSFPWKGNIDIKKLSDLYEKANREHKRIAYVSFEFNVNMAGGQPVSMDNIKEVYEFCKPRQIPVFFDATRCAENACFIQKNDANFHHVPVADILLEMFSYGDGATISCKKDMLSNLSGSLLFRDNPQWYERGLQMLQLFEGPYSSGGTSAGDMAAHAQGLREMVNDRYINSRINQTMYLGKLLQDANVPIVIPIGGHAVFLDARKFLAHIDQDQYPAQMLAAQIFIETGVRAMERGNVSKGRDPKSGENYRPTLELVRLTIPRRVYTQDHMKMVAEGIIRLYKNRQAIKGLRFIYEPEKLRFFQGRFDEIPG